MKNNFTNEEIGIIFGTLSGKLNVRINKAGNIDVVNPKSTNKYEHFVLYFTPNKKYLWRRWFDKGYCYPLNMRNRKRIGEIHYDTWQGKKFAWYQREFDIKNCEFETVSDAVDYFVKYMTKYHFVNFD